jgi:hypothetical protein
LGESHSKRNEFDLPLRFPVPGRKIEFELELRKILSKGLTHFAQVFFLTLAWLRGSVKMHWQALVPGAVLMLDEDEPVDLMVLNEELEPPPACPGELGQILDEGQTLGTARNDEQVVVAIQPQVAVQELLEGRLKPMVTAVHHQGARGLALKFGVNGVVGHG